MNLGRIEEEDGGMIVEGRMRDMIGEAWDSGRDIGIGMREEDEGWDEMEVSGRDREEGG